jgi:hypothetical protein
MGKRGDPGSVLVASDDGGLVDGVGRCLVLSSQFWVKRRIVGVGSQESCWGLVARGLLVESCPCFHVANDVSAVASFGSSRDTVRVSRSGHAHIPSAYR